MGHKTISDATTKKGNIPFSEADLAAIVLASVPMTWQNQYNLTHTTVPESARALLPDLEAIMQVMVENSRRSSRQRVRLLQPGLTLRVTLSKRRLGARLVKSLRRVAVRSLPALQSPWRSLPDPQHFGLPLL
jgi:hypothetical protein